MANERALGVSSIYAVQTWRQLAAVAEPARGCGRILIIASAGVEPRRGRRNRHHPRWAGHRLRRPRPRKRRGGRPAEHRHQPGTSLGTALVGAVLIANLTTGLVNGVQDSSAIPANVTSQATTQLEAGVPSPPTATRRPSSRRQTSRPTRPDPIVKANSDVRLAALRTLLWVVALIAVVALFFTGLIPTEPVGRAKRQLATADPALATTS
jgi:hypothetical protein